MGEKLKKYKTIINEMKKEGYFSKSKVINDKNIKLVYYLLYYLHIFSTPTNYFQINNLIWFIHNNNLFVYTYLIKIIFLKNYYYLFYILSEAKNELVF